MDLSWTGPLHAVDPALRHFSGLGVRYPCDQRTPRRESRSQLEGFQAWDRHNPLPHIALSTIAPK